MQITPDAKQFWKKTQSDLIFTQATALAYTTILSLVPLLAVAFFLFNAFGGFDSLLGKFQPFIEENLAPAFSDQIFKYLNGFMTNIHAGAVGVFGVVGFIFTSISTLATIENTFNVIWGVRQRRSWPRRVTIYWSLLTIGPLLMAMSIAMSSKALVWLKNDNGAISHLLVWFFALSPYLVSGFLFTVLYLIMPNAAVGRRDALKAGFITGLVFELAKNVYAIYAAHAISNNSLYGSVAIIPIFLLWLYVIWLICLFGAELCCYFHYRRLKIPYNFDFDRHLNPFIIADILEELSKRQTKPKGGLAPTELSGVLNVSLNEMLAHIRFLETEGWIISAGIGNENIRKYHLVVAIGNTSMSEIISQMDNRQYKPRSPRAVGLFVQMKKLWA